MKNLQIRSKTKIDSLAKWIIWVIIVVFPELMFSQNATSSFTDNQSTQTDTFVKSFTAKSVSDKVYLNALVNGITENTFYSVERSIDGTNFETIGMISFIGSQVNIDLLYSYVDETPLMVNSYYRLATYNDMNESAYTETITVVPENTSTTPGSGIPLHAKKN